MFLKLYDKQILKISLYLLCTLAVSEVVDATLYTLFDSKVTKSIFEMTGVKGDKLCRGRNGDNQYILQLIRTHFLEKNPVLSQETELPFFIIRSHNSTIFYSSIVFSFSPNGIPNKIL